MVENRRYEVTDIPLHFFGLCLVISRVGARLHMSAAAEVKATTKKGKRKN